MSDTEKPPGLLLPALAAGGSLLFAIGIAVLCSGFAHYEETPPECPDVSWAPRPPPNPHVTRFELNHVVVDDGPVRCYIACSNCTNPAIDCVVLPEAR